ncbi:reverse transcriptase (RNA-dependent DNA polymerase) domain-containing protein [Hirsutella rhossiliensis]|uniref:Reverse transcriptase (RNA-dependent DNA polymerase) domain-containing protein n=1 Tax=Hirsutella rhossiliensis TaxID=111463 RepID=A0A9P8SKC1_9HYPO|nr:reverse transcriptase (RNA-dependent DNA polymerase) domain-containing protein [Hirsutella rhossiliensis]KAH0964580.1 reverse transcriptase (RNA-dependent DNA polymerase) domain-containing protein [Hirsutella rhossiliensis]
MKDTSPIADEAAPNERLYVGNTGVITSAEILAAWFLVTGWMIGSTDVRVNASTAVGDGQVDSPARPRQIVISLSRNLTRYGSFEWLVVPFGLTGAPAAFQRYINSVLQDYLDDFVSAYIDDVLIFSSGSLQDHRDKVGKVLQRLMDAGLQLDINKSEFEVKAVKYLGFIIEAECGIRVDPEKVEAVKGWATPTNIKSVRSFIGFANFYRVFMPDFSVIAER